MANLCVTASLRNVKGNKCDVEMAALAYLIVTSRKLAAAELESSDTLRTALEAGAALGRSDANKVFPFPKFGNVTDNTGEVPRETFDDGRQQTGVEPAPSYTTLTPMGFCLAQALRAFNSYKGSAYIVDSNGVFYFANDTNLGGKPLELQEVYVGAPRPGAYTGLRGVTINVAFKDAGQFNNLSALRLEGWSPTDLSMQEDAELYEATAAAGYVFTVGGRIKCSNEEIYSAYADVFDDPTMWKVTRLDTNATVTVSTVVKDDANSAWDLTLSSSPTIATGTKLKIELDLTALKAQNIDSIESLPINVTKAA